MDKNKSNKPTQKYKFPLKTWVTSGWYLSIKYITMSSSAELATSSLLRWLKVSSMAHVGVCRRLIGVGVIHDNTNQYC